MVKDASKYIAEFIGTFMLVFTVGLIKTVGNPNASGNSGNHTDATSLASTNPETVNPTSIFGTTSVACVLMVMVYALGPISGGHFNPAVTFAALLQKEIEKKDAMMYWVVQFLAGFLAAMMTGFMYEFGQVDMSPDTKWGTGVWIGAPLIEFFYTCMLCFVVLNCCMSKRHRNTNSYYGVAIGFVIIAGGYGGGAVSGGAFNPAVALGANFMNINWKSMYLPIYIACEMAGAFVAVELFHIISPEDKVEAFVNSSRLQAVSHKIESLFDPEDTAELLGTFFLTLTWALNGLVAEKQGGSPAAVWSIAASLMCMIYAVGDISGGLFNPALTIAGIGRYYGTGEGIGEKCTEMGPKYGTYERLCDPKVSWTEGIKYMRSQAIGGAAGAACSWFVTYQWPPGAAIQPGNGYHLAQAFFAEFFGTFLLAYVVLCVALVRDPLKEYAAFAIGGCIIAGGYGFAPLSGGVLNPAISLANGILRLNLFTTPYIVVYIVAECLGGIIAAVIFKFVTHKEEYNHQQQHEAPYNAQVETGQRTAANPYRPVQHRG
jgi:aquaporin Z